MEVNNQTFIGYAAEVREIQDVNNVYAKLRAMHTDARHIVASFRIPKRNFHTHEDFCDNGEHNGGAFLLNLLVEADIQNRACVCSAHI